MKLKQIKKLCDRLYGFDLSEKKRTDVRAYARKVYCKVARESGYGLAEIGKEINRDHSSVHACINTFNSVYEYDMDMYSKITKIINNSDRIQHESMLREESSVEAYRARIVELEIELESLRSTEVNEMSKLIGDEIGSWDKHYIRDFYETRLKPYKIINKL